MGHCLIKLLKRSAGHQAICADNDVLLVASSLENFTSLQHEWATTMTQHYDPAHGFQFNTQCHRHGRYLVQECRVEKE